jgi:uncharacterized protein (DUF885 family)
MKKTVLILTVAALLLFTAGNALAQNGEDAKFKKFQDTFWDAYFKLFPTAGTMQGYSKYGDKIEDLSQASVEKFLESVDAFNQELVTKIDKTKMSPDLQVELDIMRDFLDLQVLKLENSLFTIDNPLFYNDLFVNSIRSHLVRNPGSPAAAARAKLLPGLIKKAKENLKNPPQEYTQAALGQLPGIIDFYKTDVPKLGASANGLLAETPKIVAALEDYQRFLQAELLPRSTGNFRTAEAHSKYLRYVTEGNLSIQADVVIRSNADVKNLRNAMAQICLPYYALMYPNVNTDQLVKEKGPDEAINLIIRSVFEKLKVEHMAKDEFVGKISQAAAAIKDFAKKTQIFDLPEENLSIEPMPAYMSGSLWAQMSTPGAFEASGPYPLYLQPIPADWSADQATSFLEEFNVFYVDFMTAQKVYPGTFVPVFFARKDPSAIKRISPNLALLKGWSVYAGEILAYGGYGEYDLRMRLNQFKLMLKNVIDFQMDMNVHEGTWPKEKVLDRMMRVGFMTQAEAERHWNQIVLNPGEASLTYIGYQEISELAKDYAKLKGAAFSQKEFLQKILSFGAIPLQTLKTKIAQ